MDVKAEDIMPLYNKLKEAGVDVEIYRFDDNGTEMIGVKVDGHMTFRCARAESAHIFVAGIYSGVGSLGLFDESVSR